MVVFSSYQEFKCSSCTCGGIRTSLAATCGPGVFLPATSVDVALALKPLAWCAVVLMNDDIIYV